jgi:peptidyl-prolyl cis-trans isomerase B (cyclophilin B)
MGMIGDKTQMKRAKRVITFTVAAAFGLSLFAATPASAEKKPKVSKKSSQVTKGLAICKPTKAVGHKPMRLTAPIVNKPFVNRTITLITNCGEIQIEADGINAPLTVISMNYLANKGFFDNSPCHRVTNQGIFVLQCGDPSGKGFGGPAYTAPDENLPEGSGNIYPAGSVAMANSGPNTNGSQFFIIYEDNSKLEAKYTLWGKVVKGLEIVKAVAAMGSDNSHPAGGGVPNQPISIEKAISR